MGIDLLGGFMVPSGRLPSAPVQRLLAYLAIRFRPLERGELAAVLWPYRSRDLAASNLRRTISEERSSGLGLVEADRRAVRLAPFVRVDLHDARAVVRRLASGGAPSLDDSDLLEQDLLPSWPDPWTRTERAQWHEHRVEALELLSSRLCEHGLRGEAAASALAVIDAEPHRRCGYELLAHARTADGDRDGAGAAMDDYRRRVDFASPD